jgi:outer membrane immunogenic protein
MPPLRIRVLLLGDGLLRGIAYVDDAILDRALALKTAFRIDQNDLSGDRGNKMKKFLLATVAIAALGTSASAADLAARPYTKAPPMMVAMYDWSGFYIGGNAGYGSSRDCRTNVAGTINFGCHDADGAVAGGQVGYRWQSSAWVFGLEAQGDWSDMRGSHTDVVAGAPTSDRSRLRAFGLFTGSVGYAWNNSLLYVKGGAAVTDTKFDTQFAGVTTATSSGNTQWNGTVGVGLEYGFTPNWSFGVEYDHIFTNRRNVDFNAVPGGAFVGTARDGGETDLVTARINYKWGGPVVAKY